MEAQRIDAAPARWPGSDIDKWEDVLASACDAISVTPPTLMKSITVTGRTDGIEGEARLILMLGKRLAAERGLKATFKLEGRDFTVQFSRSDGAPNGRQSRQ